MINVDRAVYTEARFKPFIDFWASNHADFRDGFYFSQLSLIDRDRNARNSFVFSVDNDELTKIQKTVNGDKGGLFIILLSAVGILLHRHTAIESLVMETPVFDPKGDLSGAGNVPLLLQVSPRDSFRTVLNRFQKQAAECYKFQNFPLSLIWENQTTPFPTNVYFCFEGLHAALPGKDLSTYDIVFLIRTSGDQLAVEIEYNTTVFEHGYITDIKSQLHEILSCFDRADILVQDIALLSGQVESILLNDFNQTNVELPVFETISHVFETHAAAHPQNPALIFQGSTYSYEDINSRANQLAHYLRNEFGVKPNDVIGLLLEKSDAMLVCILGILKAGAAYIPIGPKYPKERINFILSDSQAVALLVDSSFLHKIDGFTGHIFATDIQLSFLDAPVTNPVNVNSHDDLAYAIYTSGSTGKPKGVFIRHFSVVNLAGWQAQTFSVTPTSKILQYFSYTFDGAVGETFMALLNGATLCMMKEGELDPAKIVDFINDHNISVGVFVPSLLRQLDVGKILNRKLKVVSVGEECTNELAKKWIGRTDFINAYGPTEYTVYSHLMSVDEKTVERFKSIPIGKPMFNTRTYILDGHGNLLPVGVRGEIYISGAGLADRYVANPQITFDKFVPNKFYLRDHYQEKDSLKSADIDIAAIVSNFGNAFKPVSKPLEIDFAEKSEDVLLAKLDEDLAVRTRNYLQKHKHVPSKYEGFIRYAYEGYENTYFSYGIDEEILRELLPFRRYEGLHGLELGFGHPYVMQTLTEMGALVKGVELNPFAVQKARNQGFNVSMSEVDCCLTQFLDETHTDPASQDFVVTTLLMDRIGDPKQFLKNIFAALKEDGRFAIQTLLPIVPTDDGSREHKIEYTALHQRITVGENLEDDKLRLIQTLFDLGARDIKVSNFPYVVFSTDGVQQYNCWSFYGEKKSLTVDRYRETFYSKMYRTGDIGRYTADGNILFLGRVDRQVKIRGFRIELEEISNVIMRFANVKDAVVTVVTDANQDKQLAAYVVTGDSFTLDSLKEFMREQVPYFMVPAFYVPMKAFPVQSSGKVDLKALPAPSESIENPLTLTGPRNVVEEHLHEVWVNVLGKRAIGVSDNFFHLGGDSIKAIQVASRMQRLNYRLEINEIFQYPTIETLAPHVRAATHDIDQSPVTGNIPLIPVQHALFPREYTNKHHYTHSVMLYSPGGFDEKAVRIIFRKIQEHHDALRIRYRGDSGSWSQINEDLDYPFSLEVKEIHEEDETKRSAQITAHSTSIHESIDLASGPLMRLCLFKTTNGDHLLIVVHHFVIDGISWRIIFEDIESLFNQYAIGTPLSLPLKTDSFKTWAEKLVDYASTSSLLATKDYWQNAEKSISRIPLDFVSSEQSSISDTDIVSVTFPVEETTALLTEVASGLSAEINEILLTALSHATKEIFNLDDLVIAMEGHGRENIIADVDVSRTVGWFSSIYPVKLPVNARSPLSQLKEVKNVLRNIPDKGIGYGILRYLTSTFPGQTESPDILFNYLGQFDSDIKFSTFSFSKISSGQGQSPAAKRNHKLDVSGRVAKGQLVMNFGFSRKEFKAGTIARFSEAFATALRELILEAQKTASVPLAFLEAVAGLSTEKANALVARYNAVDAYPMTSMQEGMLFHWLLDKTSVENFMQIRYKINGTVRVDLIERAFNLLFERHDILRTAFLAEEVNTPVQVVLKAFPIKVHHEKLDGHVEESISEFLDRDRREGFDLASPPLMRLAVFELGNGKYEFVWSHHHILMDGWSSGILIKDFFEIYHGLFTERGLSLAPAAKYGDFIKWSHGQNKDKAKLYWKNYLEDIVDLTPINKIRKSKLAERTAFKYHKNIFRIDRELTQRLLSLRNQTNTTINTIVQTVWGILLGRYNNTSDSIFGAVVSGRSPHVAGVESMVGLFINTVPVRVRYDATTRFDQLLSGMQANAVAGEMHHHFSLADIQSQNKSGQDLIDHTLVFMNYPVVEQVVKDGEKIMGKEGVLGFHVSDISVFEPITYDLNVAVSLDEDLVFRFEYNEGSVDVFHIDELKKHLTRIFDQVCQNPAMLVQDIDLMDANDKKIVLEDFNRTVVPVDFSKTMVDLFEEQVARTPDNVAIVFEEKQFTYREINERINAIANYLVTTHGVRANDVVGIKANRSEWMIIGIFAIIKSGAVYLPLDVSYPTERIKYILENSQCKVFLTETDFIESIRSCWNGVVENLREISLDNIQNPGVKISQEDGLYVIYTSGSTGVPKGIIQTHDCHTALIQWQQHSGEFKWGMRVLQSSSISFDSSIMEFALSLLTGGSLFIVPETTRQDLNLLGKFIAEKKIEAFWLAASALNTLMDVSEEIWASNALQNIVSNAEQLKIGPALRKFLNAFKHVKLHNFYGPSETQVITAHCVDGNHAAIRTYQPIGRPVSYSQAYILDKLMRPVPIGVEGELYMSGSCLAKGYASRDDLTQEKFLPHKFLPSGRLYKSGDSGRWLPDGNIEYLGRKDDQVKIRGFRIELGEIESLLLKHEQVQEAVVVAKEDADQNHILVAYMVLANQQAGNATAEIGFKLYLKTFLPDYMLPSYVVIMERLPVLPTGKVAKKALRELKDRPVTTSTNVVLPKTETELALAKIWSEILGIDRVSVSDNFFEIGGHSLKATRLLSRVHSEFSVKLDLKDIFNCPTVQQLAATIESLKWVTQSRPADQDQVEEFVI